MKHSDLRNKLHRTVFDGKLQDRVEKFLNIFTIDDLIMKMNTNSGIIRMGRRVITQVREEMRNEA